MKTFSEAIQLEKVKDHHYRWSITEDWMQGRTAFGGIVTGTMVNALVQEIPNERKLRSLQVSFIGPVRDEETTITTKILRQGKSFTQAEARLIQGGQICTIVIGSFSEAHEKYLSVEPPKPPEMPAPEEVGEQPYIPGFTPTFTQHIAFRWTADSVPFSGATKAHCQGWFRLRDNSPIKLPALVTLIDAWPPPVFALADGPIRGSSVTWMVNFFSDLPDEGISPEAWWLYESHTTATHVGHSNSSASIWDAQGNLVAQSTQLVVEFSS